MRSRSYGRIVNIASIAGKEGNPRMSPYSATKAGVIALTKSLGKELATEGICVNAVSPAVVHTSILDQLTPQQVSYMTDRIPMQRAGQAGGDRSRGPLSRQPGLLVRHRAVLRRQRRPRNVLTLPGWNESNIRGRELASLLVAAVTVALAACRRTSK
jgi:NAD(P)-dependent dehydrogenase (short-subunit alcohol dehydrogenase family)